MQEKRKKKKRERKKEKRKGKRKQKAVNVKAQGTVRSMTFYCGKSNRRPQVHNHQ
jgi:hypothetical protein